jgi:hypothetical protein
LVALLGLDGTELVFHIPALALAKIDEFLAIDLQLFGEQV